MKTIIIVLALALTGCATAPDYWQQDLNSINRQWREAEPVKQKTIYKSPRLSFYSPVIGQCDL